MSDELATQGQAPAATSPTVTTPAKQAPANLSRMMDGWVVRLAAAAAAGDEDSPKAKDLRERIGREMRGVAAELAGPAPTPIERALAETSAICW